MVRLSLLFLLKLPVNLILMLTSVAGSNFLCLVEPTRYVDVYGFAPKLPCIKKVPIVTAGTDWLDPATGQSIPFDIE
jgi:hypothetical protein